MNSDVTVCFMTTKLSTLRQTAHHIVSPKSKAGLPSAKGRFGSACHLVDTTCVHI